ncbi:MAG: hypothetical protein PHV34_19045 [Verrucomicrobiae bacterium]|nr:hypothetical protein [Verrucomicrobiae bacterium]
MRPLNTYYSIYNRQNLIRIIRQLHKEGHDLSWSGMRDGCSEGLAACQYHFGSWRRAVYAAGIPYTKVKRIRNWEWNKKRIQRSLRRIYRDGEPMNYNDFARRHWNLLHVALYHFGTWKDALAAIGVDHRRVMKHRQWNKDSVLNEIKQLRKKGMDLSHRAMSQAGRNDLLGAAQNHCGSWEKALESAGLDYAKIRKVKQWSREKIIRIIRQLHRQGKDVSWSGMHRLGQQDVVRSCPWHFGSWKKAIIAAGLDYDKIRKKAGGKAKWSIPLICKEIRLLHRQDIDLSYRSMGHSGHRSLLGAASYHVGSWKKAIAEAGLDYAKICKVQQWSREKIIRIIQELHRKRMDVSASGMHRHGHRAVVRACPWHFGNWRKAIAAAGLDYRKIRHQN